MHEVGGEQGPCSTFKELIWCPRVPFPLYRGGRKQHIDLGGLLRIRGEDTTWVLLLTQTS